MSKVATWSTTPGSNNSSPPDGWPEGMQRSAVNDAAREMMASIAKWYQDSRVGIVTTGGTTAYLLTTNCAHAALSDIPILAFRLNSAPTGAMTLAVDGLTAKSVVKQGGTAVASGDFIANQSLVVVYNSNLDRFEIIGPQAAVAAATLLAAILTVDGAGSGLDADLLDGNSSAAFAKIANNLSDLASAATAFSNIKQAATTGTSGVAELATQTEMEAGTDSARVPSVSVVQNHQGVAKAWGRVSYSGGTPTLENNYNISGVSDTGVGQLGVTIGTNFSSSDYTIVATANAAGGGAFIVTVVSQASGDFDLRIRTDAGVTNDPDAVHFVCFGDQ